MTQPIWFITLEYLKVLISWPVATVVLLLLLNKFYGIPISNLISRISKGKLFGHEFEIYPQTQPIESSEDILTPTSLRYSIKTPSASDTSNDDQSLVAAKEAERPSNLPDELINDPSATKEIEHIKQNPESALISIKKLSKELQFERIYSRTYGSQLRLLEAASKTYGPLQSLAFSGFFNDHLKIVGNADFHSFIGWLVNNDLMTVTTNHDQSEFYKITEFGREFISYLRGRYGASYTNRPG